MARSKSRKKEPVPGQVAGQVPEQAEERLAESVPANSAADTPPDSAPETVGHDLRLSDDSAPNTMGDDGGPGAAAAPPAPESEHASVRPWTILFYICADVTDEHGNAATPHSPEDSLTAVATALGDFPADEAHVLLQVDTLNHGASRWRLEQQDGRYGFVRVGSAPASNDLRLRINTGDTREAIDFLEWGLRQGPARHVAVVISGWGISAGHVARMLDTQGFGRRTQRELLKKQNLFSICHDIAALDALEAHELRNLFEPVTKRLGRKIDVIVLDAGMTAFIELAYEFRDAARYLVAAHGLLPDSLATERGGSPDQCWPWSTVANVLEAASTKLAAREPGEFAVGYARLVNEAIAQTGSWCRQSSARLCVLDLEQIGSVVALIDHVTSTLLHHLGDWHVLNALSNLWSTSLELIEPSYATESKIACRDVFQLMLSAEASLRRELTQTKRRHGMRQRMEHVVRVVSSVRRAMVPEWWLDGFVRALKRKRKRLRESAATSPAAQRAAAMLGRFLRYLQECRAEDRNETAAPLATDGTMPAPPAPPPRYPLVVPLAPDDLQSLLILLPERRDLMSPDPTDSDSPTSAIRQDSYSELDFSRDAGWSFLVSALQLITWKPHVLWRLVSSTLFSRSGSTRDMMLRRLFSSTSVLDTMQSQFRVLRSDQALRLSVSKKDECSCDEPAAAIRPVAIPECLPCQGTDDREHFTVQLESAAGESVVSENTAPIYRSTFDSAVKSFEAVLNGPEPITNSVELLQQLGRSLGEDVVQDLRTTLEAKRAELSSDTDVAPHLRLQLDMPLMAYPWELISDGHGMLFERFALGRQFVLPPRRSFRKRDTGPLRVLVIGDPVFGAPMQRKFHGRLRQLPGAVREAAAVVDLFRDLREELQGIVDVWIESHLAETVTVNQVRALLRSGRYDIIHFAGHACFNVDDPEGSGWLLSDGLLHAREIRNTLEWTDAPPWLVYANACEAGMERSEATRRYEYQTDVYGLSSAFNAHGVRGYIAPLWPIDDEVAVLMATEFYCRVLLDRRSLGEAVFLAKRTARRMLVGTPDAAGGSHLVPQTALSWASVVLYGDPTQRLFQTLWGGAAAATDGRTAEEGTGVPLDGSPTLRLPTRDERLRFETKSPPAWTPSLTARRRLRMPRLEQAPAKQVLDLIRSPSLSPLSTSRAVADLPADCERFVELVEENGVRLWRVVDRFTGKADRLAESGLAGLVVQPEFRSLAGVNRGLTDHLKILGRWMLDKLPFVGSGDERALARRFAEQFDRDTVAQTGLREYRDGQLVPISPATWRPLARDERLLLVIHGTFSKTESPIDGFGTEFWKRFPVHESTRAGQRRDKYRIVGYSHWTLSKTPDENAAELVQELASLSAQSKAGGAARPLFDALASELQPDTRLSNDEPPIDVIAHSRGGLVTRAFVELEQAAGRPIADFVRHAVFVGTPNAGTQLANPKNFGRAANFLVNMLHRDKLGILGPLSGFLAEAALRSQLPNVPGLHAQNPEQREQQGSLLHRLHHGPTPVFPRANGRVWPKYLCVAANFEPGEFEMSFDVSSLSKFLQEAKSFGKHQAVGKLDETVDAYLNVTNDLVVDTHGVWAFRRPAAEAQTAPPDVPLSQILLFNPCDDLPLPTGLTSLPRAGTHHCNLFELAETQRFLLRHFGMLEETTAR